MQLTSGNGILRTAPGKYLNKNNLTAFYRNATIVINSSATQTSSFTITNAKGITLQCFNKGIINKGYTLLALKQPLAAGIYFLTGDCSRRFLTLRLLVP
jgi:hypothetical protein